MALAHPPICDFGWKPNDATLLGIDGQHHSILEQAGPRGLLVAFICNHCPYVVGVIERIVHEAQALEKLGIGTVAICANDATAYPADSYENMAIFAKKHGFPFAYLHDETQEVARTWDAVCTPDFFGFNQNMELQYRGRLDSAGMSGDTGNMRRDLYEAMKQIAETGKGPRDQIASMGCSIKWKDTL